jgi:hypothetical protein
MELPHALCPLGIPPITYYIKTSKPLEVGLVIAACLTRSFDLRNAIREALISHLAGELGGGSHVLENAARMIVGA